MAKKIKKGPLTHADASNNVSEMEKFIRLVFLKPLKGQPVRFGTKNEVNVLKHVQILWTSTDKRQIWHNHHLSLDLFLELPNNT